MRKMWVNKKAYEDLDIKLYQYLSFYHFCEHPSTEQEVLCFTPKELEAHERMIWEAAQTIRLRSIYGEQCYEAKDFNDWKKEQEK